MAIRGQSVTSGYLLEEGSCKGYPDIAGNYIDFGDVKLRDGRFRDVDRKDNYRDRVVGELVRPDRIVGSSRSYADYRGPGPICRSGEKFTLDRVGRARWRGYTELVRDLDPRFPGDGRTAARR